MPPFDKLLKQLVKKYPSLNEFAKLLAELEVSPAQGTRLGNNCYKIRIAIASKKKGKSESARIISHFLVAEQKFIYLRYMINLINRI